MLRTLITAKELASILKISPRTVYNLVWKKKITSVKVAGSLRFSLTDIEQWLNTQKREAVK